MADLQRGSGGDGGNEISMEKRLLLAFLLMGAVLFVTPYFYKPKPPVEPAEQNPPAAEMAAEKPLAKPALPEVSAEKAAEKAVRTATAGAVQAETEQTYTITTDLHQVVFSNRGAVIKSWILLKYQDANGDPLELINQKGVGAVGYPFALDFIDDAPALDPNSALFAAKITDDGLGIDFKYSDGVTMYRKSFRFRQGDYLVDVTSEANHDGSPVRHLLAWRGGFGDVTVHKAASAQHSLRYDLAKNKLISNDSDDAEDGAITEQGTFSFAGLEDSYFAAVALPGNGKTFTLRSYSDNVLWGAEEKPILHVGMALGGEGHNEFPLFVGPKDVDILASIDPRLKQLVDFGWFSILAKPIFYALKYVHDHWISNYGWAIILLTIAINVITVPLKFTSMKSMKKMQVLQPEIKKIQEKYKGLSMRDPKKQKQNEEMMALYKKHDVNPMGGCLPMALQIPFFFAFYKVLRVAIELRGAHWLWVADLSQPETLAIRVLPVAMVISQFASQRMTPTTAAPGGQQRVMYLMPLMMGFLFYGVSSGLVLYWLTSNVVGVAQQLLMNKFSHLDEVPAAAAVVEAKSNKKKGRKR